MFHPFHLNIETFFKNKSLILKLIVKDHKVSFPFGNMWWKETCGSHTPRYILGAVKRKKHESF